MLCGWLSLALGGAVLQWGCTKLALLQEKPLLPPCTVPHPVPREIPLPARFVLAGWEHTQLSARAQPTLPGFSPAQPRDTNTPAGPAGACLFSWCKESRARAASPLSHLLRSPGAGTALSHCSRSSLSHPGEANGAAAPAQGWTGGARCQRQGRKETACAEGRRCQEGGQAHPARNSLEPGDPASEKPDWNGKCA